MNKLCLIAVLFLIVGCSSPRFYNELKNTASSRSSIGLGDKIVFKKLKSELKTSSHIIYLYLPLYTGFTLDSRGLVYDADNDKYYTILFERDQVKVETVIYDELRDSYELFVLHKYLQGKYEYLKDLGEDNRYRAGEQALNCIYDISIPNLNNAELCFWNFLFMDGKPYNGFEN